MSKTFAEILNGTVINVVVAESKPIAELVTGHLCVEYTADNPAGIGWKYDDKTESFSAPQDESALSNSEEVV